MTTRLTQSRTAMPIESPTYREAGRERDRETDREADEADSQADKGQGLLAYR